MTFATDIFHPLITPLTTYMYTTDIQDNGTVSATDDERLPPGGFSLRHGFPDWFGRGSRSRVASGQLPLPLPQPPPPQQAAPPPVQTPPRSTRGSSLSNQSTPASNASPPGPPHFMQTRRREVSTYDVLRYIRSTFDDENVLDSVPLEAAGNPGAWHAWRTHQRQLGKVLKDAGSSWHPGRNGGGDQGTSPSAERNAAAAAGTAVRKPGEWNWEHVWEERVKKGIAASLSEPVLYGNAGATDDVVSCGIRPLPK